jgi:poly(ribitol-phosphate) beta-N-acetylglucosaminyltransferase
MANPDVSVVIPTFNTLPYLHACLTSVFDQTLGMDRIEIVAIDDGSTDGCAEVLDQYAATHPAFTVLHQPNSGGPAAPCNRGLEIATGRYAFFLGADDYLGTDALRRLVEAADAWESDVIFGRVEGVGGRKVDQRIYSRTEADLNFIDFPLAYALSNTKLFRRDLLNRYKIRYPLDLRVGSDQPFAVEAMTRARRVSVLADYTYYYAVRREDSTNITFSATWRERFEDISAIVRHIASVVEPGPVRDAILKRHFNLELGKLIRVDLVKLEPSEQRELAEGIGGLVTDYLTGGLSNRLWAQSRLRLRLAQAGQLELLREVIAYQNDTREPPLALRGDRVFVWFPGFDDHGAGPLTSWYELTCESTWDRLVRGLSITGLGLDEGHLQIEGKVGLTPDSNRNVVVALLGLAEDESPPPNRRFSPDSLPAALEWPVTLIPTTAGAPAELMAEVPLQDVVPRAASQNQRWSVRLRLRVAEWCYDLPLRWPGPEQQTVVRKGLRDNLFTVAPGAKKEVVLTAVSAPRMSWPWRGRARAPAAPKAQVGFKG